MTPGNPTLMRQKIASITQMLRLPSVCVLCNQYHRGSFAVCHACSGFLKPLEAACRICAHPLPDTNFAICGHCSKKKPAFDNSFIAYRFEEPLRTLLHEFKYHEGLYLRTFLSQLMLNSPLEQVKQTECLIPVPLHPKRLQQRGFNQAAELAKLLAKQLNIPCELKICTKILHTEPQASLNNQQRQKNLRHAFKVKATGYQHITLIDDLFTTGSTVNELAKTLKGQGIRQVDVWCCARATLI